MDCPYVDHKPRNQAAWNTVCWCLCFSHHVPRWLLCFQCSLEDSSQIHSDWFDKYLRDAAKEAGVLAETYESACFFIHVGSYSLWATTIYAWVEQPHFVYVATFYLFIVDPPAHGYLKLLLLL